MSADIDESPPTQRRTRHPRGHTPQASTSIRVPLATRDALARQAAQVGKTLSSYLTAVAAQADREAALAEYRACALEAQADPGLVTEMVQWDDMDDGLDLGEDFA